LLPVKHYVDIHCKPYVAHYLSVKYGNGETAISLPKRSMLKTIIHSCLCTKFYPSEHYQKKGFPSVIRLQVTGHEITKFGHTINISNHYYINSLIEEKLKIEMAVMISSYRQNGLSWSAAIRTYQEELGYTDEVFDYKAIERSYERFLTDAKNIFSKTVGKQNLA